MKSTFLYYSLICVLTASASDQTKWSADRTHSSINFSVAHLVISEVTGQFKEFDATMESGTEDFSDAKINVTINAKSIDTGTKNRDNHLRGTDFFNTDVDSIITFISTKIEKTGSDIYKIYGVLTIRGIAKEVVLDTKFNGMVNSRKGMVAAFKATTAIARKNWGLDWNRALETGGVLVGESVNLTILIEFIKNKS